MSKKNHPLGLNPGVLANAGDALKSLFGHLKIKNDYYVDTSCWMLFGLCNEILKKESKTYLEESEKLDDILFATFACDWLERRIRSKHEYSSKVAIKNLNEYHDFKDLEAVSKSLLTEFSELPHENVLVVQLNKPVSEFLMKYGTEIEINEGISVVTNRDSLTQYPRSTGSENRDRFLFNRGLLWTPRDKDSEWPDSSAFLIVKQTGFINHQGSTQSFHEMVGKVRAFLGMLLCTGGFVLDQQLVGINRLKAQTPVYRKGGVEFVLIDTPELPTDVGDLLARLKIGKPKSEHSDGEALAEFIRHVNLIRVGFGNSENCRKIQTAANWYAYSALDGERITSFIQAMISIEAILGEKTGGNAPSTSVSIADRASYMISKKSSERDAIRSDVRQMYGLRNRIVHEGHNRLSLNDIVLSGKLKMLCRLVIDKELRLIYDDKG